MLQRSGLSLLNKKCCLYFMSGTDQSCITGPVSAVMSSCFHFYSAANKFKKTTTLVFMLLAIGHGIITVSGT